MTVARLERWIELLPPQELTQPVVTVDGQSLTPTQMLSEARAGTELGRKAQAQWESGSLGTEEEMLIERIKRRLARYPKDKPVFRVLGAPTLLTPGDILANVEAKTEEGKRWLRTEGAYLRYLDKLKERV